MNKVAASAPKLVQHGISPLDTSDLQACPQVEQLAHLNHCLQVQGLATLDLTNESRPVSARNVRVSGALVPAGNGPLVSVLLTSFNSADWVHTAVTSVLAQTWSSLELIVVDDASTDDTFERVMAMAAGNARVRALRLPRNAGTYVAKHVALQHAQGKFVTCHDSDDWSHPQKIERQVRPLLENPWLVCTTSCWIRVTDDGQFYSRLGPPFMRLNPSSPLFRRELVLQHAGAWDVVRTGADSEFLARIKAVFGESSVLRIGAPLALGSHRPGSLMTAEDTGYSSDGRSASRQGYWDAWNGWHASAKARGVNPWLPPNPLLAPEQRAFEAPGNLLVATDAIAECLAAHGVAGFMAQREHRPHWLALTTAVSDIPSLEPLLGGPVIRDAETAKPDARTAAVLAWGRKPSALKAEQRAQALGLPLTRLEDGFIRSMLPGVAHPPLSLVVDGLGMYYDATRPSALERLLSSDDDLLAGDAAANVQRARALMERYSLSKYNHAPPLWLAEARAGRALLRAGDRQRVLVVDQTAGDMSIAFAQASEATFAQMLQAALDEHPDATVYVKTHPQTAAGQAGGHFTDLAESDRVVPLREAIEPLSLLREMDVVYVVSSTLGFEALLAGKPVHCFGLPWYAGWGATQDRQRCERRMRQRSVDELFAAAYLRYCRYLNPETHERGTIFDVIHWLARQRRMAGLLRDGAPQT